MLRGVLTPECANPAFLEVRTDESVFIPVFVEPVVVNAVVENPVLEVDTHEANE